MSDYNKLNSDKLDRFITGNYGEDFFTDAEEDEPDEGDGYVFGTTLGTEASLDGKNLGVFEDEDAAEQAIRTEGNKIGWFPNVWRVSDHGNHHLIENFWNDQPTHGA